MRVWCKTCMGGMYSAHIQSQGRRAAMGMCFHIPAGGQPPSPLLLLHHILLKYPTPLVVLVDLLVVVNLSIFADFFLCLSVPWESQEQQVVSKSLSLSASKLACSQQTQVPVRCLLQSTSCEDGGATWPELPASSW